jgi:L-serine dehydratase
MQSIKKIFRIGMGPSSSHTMAPRLAAEQFLHRGCSSTKYRVTLYGSLALTGRGHLTHEAIINALSPWPVEIVERGDQELPLHPNGMIFEALDERSIVLDSWRVYSVGGGELLDEKPRISKELYTISTMEHILKWCEDSGNPIWMLVQECEDENIWDYLNEMWKTMDEAIARGLNSEGALPGELRLCRKAHSVYNQAERLNRLFLRTGLLTSYALAVAEENASGSMVVTAPTCGSCGVLPAVLKYFQNRTRFKPKGILRALATAGLIGNLIKTNASISGAEVGCQGEIGAACAMGAACAAQILGGTPHQIEYAAEMGLEHHLGLTCDPVAGLVQIPCIERNAMAAVRAVHCAEYALLSDGRHRISFDQVVETMNRTGHDLSGLYRETARGGLALTYKSHSHLES